MWKEGGSLSGVVDSVPTACLCSLALAGRAHPRQDALDRPRGYLTKVELPWTNKKLCQLLKVLGLQGVAIERLGVRENEIPLVSVKMPMRSNWPRHANSSSWELMRKNTPLLCSEIRKDYAMASWPFWTRRSKSLTVKSGASGLSSLKCLRTASLERAPAPINSRPLCRYSTCSWVKMIFLGRTPFDADMVLFLSSLRTAERKQKCPLVPDLFSVQAPISFSSLLPFR